MKGFWRYLAMLTLVASLAACSTGANADYATAYSHNFNRSVAMLRAAHAIVVVQGTVTRIVLPNTVFFIPGKQQIRPEKVASMHAIMGVIGSYTHPNVVITGYWDDSLVNDQQARQVSLDYARVVASQLWNGGLPIASMQIYGAGNTAAVSVNRGDDRAQNQRVEIVVK